MTLTLNVDLDIIQIHLHTKFHGPRCYSYRNINYCSVNFGPVTDGQKVTHKSLPCISTGRLNKIIMKVATEITDRLKQVFY